MQNVFNANTFNTNGAGIFNLAPATNACRTCHKGRGVRLVQGVGKLAKKAAESHIKHTGKASGGLG